MSQHSLQKIVTSCYVLTTIIAPWITLFAVYGPDDAWTLIGLYSHLFLFPLLFGAVQVLFLLRLITILLRSRARKLMLRVGLPFALITTLVGVYIQGAERPALFELKPARLHATIPNGGGTTFIQHLKSPAKENRTAFEAGLPTNSWQIPKDDRCVAEFVCGFAIVLQIFIWFWTAFAFCWAARLIAVHDSESQRQRKTFIPLMLWTLILSLPWFAMRKVFENYRDSAYVNLEIPHAVILLGFVFVLGSLFLAAATWRVIGERLNAAVGLVSTLGISGLFFKDSWLEAVFPRTLSVSQFLLMVLIVAFVLTVLLVKMPNDQQPTVGPIRISKSARRKKRKRDETSAAN
jgi:hypothetical protein